MKQLLLSALLSVIAILPLSAQDRTVPLIQNVQAYESISLNGEWNYIVDCYCDTGGYFVTYRWNLDTVVASLPS